MRIPDVTFVSLERLPTIPDKYIGGPDLAVEVLSPSETATKVLDKVMLYLNAGMRLVWAVVPEEQVVYVYRPAEEGMLVQKFGLEDTLQGGRCTGRFYAASQESIRCLGCPVGCLGRLCTGFVNCIVFMQQSLVTLAVKLGTFSLQFPDAIKPILKRL